MHPALLLVHPTNFKKPKTAPACLQKLFYIFKNNGTVECLRSASLLPHSLSRFLSSVHSASSLFFVSLHLIRFGEGEGNDVQRCGGRRRHTKYAFVLGVHFGVPQVV